MTEIKQPKPTPQQLEDRKEATKRLHELGLSLAQHVAVVVAQALIQKGTGLDEVVPIITALGSKAYARVVLNDYNSALREMEQELKEGDPTLSSVVKQGNEKNKWFKDGK